MKKVLLILICALNYLNLFADGGNCVRYKVNIKTNDAKIISGYIFVHNYNPVFEFKEISFKEYISKYAAHKKGQVILYTKVVEILYPKLSYNSEQLKNMCDEFLSGLKHEFEINDWKTINTSYVNFKSELREKNIIIVRLNFLP